MLERAVRFGRRANMNRTIVLSVMAFSLVLFVSMAKMESDPHTNNITIINAQSYPSVGGNWTVRFNTTGTADLTITAVNGTAWNNENEDNDLKFLEVKCGDAIKSYEWVNNSVVISDYSCDEEGSEVSKVLTPGKHSLEFKFGDDVAYAYNLASFLRMEWGNKSVSCETWTTVNLEKTYVSPIVVVTPEYTSTTNANGIVVWTRNIDENSFEVKASDENFNCQNTIKVNYIVMEQGNWTLPGTSIKVEAGQFNTIKYGYTGAANWECPARGEIITFTDTFSDTNPLVLSSRATDVNSNTWGTTFQHGVSAYNTDVTSSQMCIGLSESKAAVAPTDFSQEETINWIAMDSGTGTIGSIDFEIGWWLSDTGPSGTNWINGYADPIPFIQNWATSWSSAPQVIVVGQTSVKGSDGSWPVLYDNDITYIRMFVDEANERAHSGSESGGGWAFDTAGSYSENDPPTTPTNITCDGGECNITVDTGVELNASGSIDGDGDNITYYIEASLLNITTTDDLETGEKQAKATSAGAIGETGTVSIANFAWTLVAFTNTYASTPVVIATPVTQNGAAAEDDSYIIPTISMVNTTHFNVTICQDNGATTCDSTVTSETLHYFVFDVDEANQYSWIDVGTLTVTTEGADTPLTYGKTFTNVPVIWTTPQTYSQNGNIAAVVWVEDAATKSTATAPLLGCTHQGTANACDAATPSETVGYVAIDTNNVDITSFQTGSADISGSTWTAATFSPTYTNPRVMVTQNDDDGGEDPQYPWARSVVSGGMDYRYCEEDAADVCNTHTGEVVNWFAIEAGDIIVGGAVDDTEAVKGWETYNDILSSDWKNITELNVTVNVSVYNNSGSTQNGNNVPDLQLEMYNGSEFVEVGNFSADDGLGNFTLTVIDSTILAGWQTMANSDLRIRGVDFDYNDPANIDEINWTDVWVTVNGTRWIELGNHTNETTLDWNTSGIVEQTCIDLRTRAIDIDGTNTYSAYFTKGACLNISHPPKWRYQGQNTSTPVVGDSVLLYAQGRDEIALDFAVLSTNESGSWENKTANYSSPMDMQDAANTWNWSNFTWSNSSVAGGTTVGWRIWYNDTAGNWNVTGIWTFTVEAVFVDIVPSQALTGGILFGSVDPDTNDNPALNNSNGPGGGTAYNITIDPSTNVNVDLYHSTTTPNLSYATYAIGIENVTYQANTTSNTGDNLVPSGSPPINTTYWIIGNACSNMADESNCWIRYWLDVPYAQLSGDYNTTYKYCGVQTGAGALSCG